MKNIIKTDIFIDYLNNTGAISPSELNLIIEHGKTVSYDKKDIIFKQNTLTSHVMFIKSGFVKIFKEGRNNKSIILKIATPGNFLGLISIFGDNTFQYSAAAIDQCSIFFIDINTFYQIIEQNGIFAKVLLKDLSSSNMYMFDRLISQYQKQLPGKIADLIIYFSEYIYKSDHFDFPLTRNELAELAGTTKESLIRTLTEFKNDKIIDLDGKHVKINSKEIIRTLSKIG